MGFINKVDMVCLSPVGHGAKHHIPQATNIPYQPLLIKPIFSVLAHAEKQFFTKLVIQCLIVISSYCFVVTFYFVIKRLVANYEINKILHNL